MRSMLDSLLVLVFVLNISALGTSRIVNVIWIVAAQGFVLALLPVLAHSEVTGVGVVVGVSTAAIKGVTIPLLLQRAMREVQIRREVEPLISTGATMMLGAVGAFLALAFTRVLPLVAADQSQLIVPAALATVLAGFLLLTTRVKAISQVLGYLVLENGIFVFGLLLIEAIPLVVEVGVLLDLVVAIFVMAIMLTHIRREFSTTNTSDLSALRED